MPGRAMIEPYVGYYGKLPAHGDFIGAGLERQSLSVLDAWIGAQLAEAQARLLDDFETIWHAAPSWCFTWRAGVIDPVSAASGVWMPSIDKVGRCFPCMLMMLHDPDQSAVHVLPAFEALLRRAITQALSVQALEHDILAAAEPPQASGVRVSDVWWRPGSHASHTVHGALLRDQAFDWLLDDTGRRSV